MTWGCDYSEDAKLFAKLKRWEELRKMSVSKWFYHPGVCDQSYCVGECDNCDVCMNPDQYGIDDTDEDDEEQEIASARKGEE